MRNTFIKHLTEQAAINKNIVLIVGDLGYSVVENFQKRFPNRFYNAGISEQNMASMAAGLASEGFHVFIYSIANFPTFRCAEQIRNDIGYHNLPVTIVTVGGGLSYGNLGYSHHAIQDLGLMRLFPEITISAPGDPIETKMCLTHLIDNPGPSYLRLKKSGETTYHKKHTIIEPGIWKEIRKSNNKKIFLTTGGGLHLAHKIIENNSRFTDFGIYTCPLWGAKFKNLQQSQINDFQEIITVEDHLLDAGFGSWLRESITIPESHLKISHRALDLNIIGSVGTEEYLLKKVGF